MRSHVTRITFSSAVLIAGAWIAFSVAHANEIPSAGEVSIQSVSAFGSGCQDGTVAAALSPDRQDFSLLFDHFEVHVGGSDPVTDRRNCEINVVLNVPAGWSYALHSADYRGFASVDPGAAAIHQVVYEHERANPADTRNPNRPGRFTFATKQFFGPTSENYIFRSEIPLNKLNWSPCTNGVPRDLHISTIIGAQAKNPGARAMISLDSVDASIRQSYGMKWRRCQQNNVPGGPGAPRPAPPRFGPRPPRF